MQYFVVCVCVSACGQNAFVLFSLTHTQTHAQYESYYAISFF